MKRKQILLLGLAAVAVSFISFQTSRQGAAERVARCKNEIEKVVAASQEIGDSRMPDQTLKEGQSDSSAGQG